MQGTAVGLEDSVSGKGQAYVPAEKRVVEQTFQKEGFSSVVYLILRTHRAAFERGSEISPRKR